MLRVKKFIIIFVAIMLGVQHSTYAMSSMLNVLTRNVTRSSKGFMRTFTSCFSALTKNYFSIARATMPSFGFSRFFKRDYSHYKLKGIDALIVPAKKHLSPVHGAAFIETPYMRQLYEFSSTKHPLHALVRTLFFLQGEQFRPTQLKTSPAYSLTPVLIGKLLDLIETGRLSDAQARKMLVSAWHAEHIKQSGTKTTHEKINQLVELFFVAATHDKYDTQLLLLKYLNARSTTKQEMYNFLEAANMLVPVGPATYKQYLGSEYTAKDYDHMVKKIEKKPDADWQVARIMRTREQSVFANIMHRLSQNIFPRQVVADYYGYKGKPIVPNCAETAFQDMFNVLLYNSATKKFDLDLLPKGLQLQQDFATFYQKYADSARVNDKEVGQAFMDLVSGHEFLTYIKNKNYELDAQAVTNFVKLANYFFSTKAKDIEELGALLSDERRTVVFNKTQPVLDNKEVTPAGYGSERLGFIMRIMHPNKTVTPIQAHMRAWTNHVSTAVEGRAAQLASNLYDERVPCKLFKKAIEDTTVVGLVPLFAHRDMVSQEDMPALIKRHLPYSLNMQDPHDIAVLLERGDTTLHTEKLTGALKSKIIELLRSANFNDEKLIGLILQKKMYLDPEIEGLLEKHRDKVKSCLSEPQISSYGRAILISHSCDEVAMLYKKYAAEIVMPMYWIGGFYNLKKAIEKLDIEWVHAIIKHGGNINKEMAGRSLLVEMVDQKNLKAVQLLLELGADVNSGDVWGKTPLMRACSIQYWSPSPFFESSLKDTVYKIITLLLEAGADVHAEMRGKSILAFAKEQGDEHIIALLKNAGA